MTSLISAFILYRETAVPDVFEPIHSQPYQDYSEFTDTLGMSNLWAPSVRSSRYRLVAVDSCGNHTLPGPAHRTLHLSLSLGFNSVNLRWNKYEGYPVERYIILRGDTITQMDSVGVAFPDPNDDEVLWNDFPAPTGKKLYQVVYDFPESYSCSPSSGRMMAQRRRTASNISTNNILQGPGQGLEEYQMLEASIYPNPTDGNVFVELESFKNDGDIVLRVIDGLGQIVASHELSGFKGKRVSLINLDQYAAGVYTIQITNAHTTINKRIVLK
jgi:hypothetical protein